MYDSGIIIILTYLLILNKIINKATISKLGVNESSCTWIKTMQLRYPPHNNQALGSTDLPSSMLHANETISNS